MSGCSKSLKTHHLLDKLYAMNMNFEKTNIFKICWEYALSGKEVMTTIHSKKTKVSLPFQVPFKLRSFTLGLKGNSQD